MPQGGIILSPTDRLCVIALLLSLFFIFTIFRPTAKLVVRGEKYFGVLDAPGLFVEICCIDHGDTVEGGPTPESWDQGKDEAIVKLYKRIEDGADILENDLHQLASYLDEYIFNFQLISTYSGFSILEFQHLDRRKIFS